MSNFLYYDTPVNKCREYYGDIQFPFKSEEIVTQLPRDITIIRTVAALAFSALVASFLSTTIFCWPVFIVGGAFAGWTSYSHLFSKDPLMDVFYTILGGKDKFERLPEIQLLQNPNEKISDIIAKLTWDQLEHPISRTVTIDGRNVIIIKGLSRKEEVKQEDDDVDPQTKSVLAFVEKCGPRDVFASDIPPSHDSFLYAIFAIFQKNIFKAVPYCSGAGIGSKYNNDCRICSSITGKMANEFFVQINR